MDSAKSGTAEFQAYLKEAEDLLKDARAEAQTKIAESKNKSISEAETKLTSEKLRLEAEFAKNLKYLEAERALALKDLDHQVADISACIIKRVLPDGFSLYSTKKN